MLTYKFHIGTYPCCEIQSWCDKCSMNPTTSKLKKLMSSSHLSLLVYYYLTLIISTSFSLGAFIHSFWGLSSPTHGTIFSGYMYVNEGLLMSHLEDTVTYIRFIMSQNHTVILHKRCVAGHVEFPSPACCCHLFPLSLFTGKTWELVVQPFSSHTSNLCLLTTGMVPWLRSLLPFQLAFLG